MHLPRQATLALCRGSACVDQHVLNASGFAGKATGAVARTSRQVMEQGGAEGKKKHIIGKRRGSTVVSHPGSPAVRQMLVVCECDKHDRAATTRGPTFPAARLS